MTGHATRECGRAHARWVRDLAGPEVLQHVAHLIVTLNHGAVGPFGMGFLDVARGILSTTNTIQ